MEIDANSKRRFDCSLSNRGYFCVSLSTATWDSPDRWGFALVNSKLDLDIVSANQEALRLFDAPGGLVGLSLLTLVATTHHHVLLEHVAKATSTHAEPLGFIALRLRTETVHPRVVYVAVTQTNGADGALLAWTCFLNPPDPRLQLLTCAPDTLLLVGDDGRIEYVNDRVNEMFGYAPKELVGQTVDVLLPERFQAAHVTQRANYSKSPTPRPMGSGQNLMARRKDGSEFAAEVALAPLTVGEHLKTSAAVRDVTQKRLTELRINTVHRVEAIGRLTGGIAHDLNNILTAVLGFAESALEGVGDHAPTVNVADDIQQVVIASERAKQLIEKLLAFSRRRPADPVVVDVNDALVSLTPMLTRLLGSTIEYKTSLMPHLWSTRIDPGAIEQIIVNLCVNAKDAMPKGGSLLVETSNVTVDEHYGAAQGVPTVPGDYVLLAVSDTGHGMDEETQKHIFEPFSAKAQAWACLRVTA